MGAARNDFGIGISSNLPPLGERSQRLRIVSETWNPQTMIMNVSAVASHAYELSILNPKQLRQVDGAEVARHGSELSEIRIRMPADDGSAYVNGRIIFHFSPSSSSRTAEKKGYR